MRKFILFLLLAVLFLQSAPSFAGGGGLTGGATEWTQLANNSELANILGQNYEQVANQVKQITNQVKQIEEIVRQGKGLTDRVTSLAQGQFQSISSAVNAATGLYRDGNNFGKTLAADAEKSKNTGTNADEQRASTVGTMVSVGNAIAEATKQQKEDLSALQKMYNRNYTATTPMQAQQIQNEIGILANEQMIKTRTDINNINVLLLEEKKRRLEELDAGKLFIKNQITDPGTISVKYKKNKK